LFFLGAGINAAVLAADAKDALDILESVRYHGQLEQKLKELYAAAVAATVI